MTMPMGATGAIAGNNMTGMKDKIPKGYRMGQLQQFTPQQMQLFQQMFSHVGPQSFMSRLAGGEEGMFEQMEAPAMRQFGEMQGGLASRFSGMGMGGRRSSGFQNTMNQATMDFAQDLQSKRLELQRQAIMDLMGLSHQLMGERPYEKMLIKKQTPFWQQLLLGGAEAGKDIAMGAAKHAVYGG